jgi:hypothetical protein
MRNLAPIAVCAAALIGYVVFHGRTAQAADCRLAGTWVADNGDVMVLGGIRTPAEGGSYRFRTGPNAFMTMMIDGGYRLEGNMFRFKGTDQNSRPREVSVPIRFDNPAAPSVLWLSFDNKVTGQSSQSFRLQQRDTSCA